MLSVDEFMLSVRAVRALKKAGITTIKKLYETTEAEILKLPNIGWGTLKEIREARENPPQWGRKRDRKRLKEIEIKLADLKKRRSSLKRDLTEWDEIDKLAEKLRSGGEK